MTDDRQLEPRRSLDRKNLRQMKELTREVQKYRKRVRNVFLVSCVFFGGLLYLQEVERYHRSDQTCKLFEGNHLRDVQQLRDTYRYLLTIPPADRNNSLNKAILIMLPNQEQTAQDHAPAYCDTTYRTIPIVGNKHDFGNPEPDPVIPKRPRALTKRLEALRGRSVASQR